MHRKTPNIINHHWYVNLNNTYLYIFMRNGKIKKTDEQILVRIWNNCNSYFASDNMRLYGFLEYCLTVSYKIKHSSTVQQLHF